MLQIKQLLEDRKKEKTAEVKKYNLPYEQARRIADLVGCSPLIIMRLQKKHGVAKVQGLYSWLKDYPNLDKRRAIGLLCWKLKQQ